MDSTNNKTPEEQIEELAATFGDHQITDSEGNLMEGEEPSTQSTAAEDEETSEEDTPTAEKPAESDVTEPKTDDTGTEPELGVDDTGKRYVPEKRFKDVYGKWKDAERKAAEVAKAGQVTAQTADQPKQTAMPDKAALLEVELLNQTLPQFNPESADYSQDLDEMAADIYKSNQGITLLEAGRRAIKRAKNLAGKVSDAKAEARTVKAIQSDQGITGRSSQRTGNVPDPDSMSAHDMEVWLKANGQWS